MMNETKQPIYSDDGGTGFEVEAIESNERRAEPFDPSQVRIETMTFSIDLLLNRIKHKELDLEADFQIKAGIWSDKQKSRLIESILIRIPLPVFYIDVSKDDKWLVVDGLQRLSTLDQFVLKNDLGLTGLEFYYDFEEKTYEELPRNFQRRILETAVIVYLIRKDSPAQLKFNIFRRLNTGGTILTAQEIRHVLHQGKASQLLKFLADSEEFKTATDNSIRTVRMVDRECILRFLAFSITPYHKYMTSGFDFFLNDAMDTINCMNENEIHKLEYQFFRAMKNAYSIFGPYCFRKIYEEKIDNNRKYPINKALFESWSVSLSMLNDGQLDVIIERKEYLIKIFVRLLEFAEFGFSISQQTGSKKNVFIRFSSIENIIQEVLNASISSAS